MAQDGQDRQSAIPSGGLPARSASARLEPADVARCFVRLAAAYGDDRRLVDPHQAALLEREWLEQLGHLEPHTVNVALGKVIRECKFWPSIAEVAAACEPYDTRTTEEKFGQRHSYRPEPRPDFCREGRTEAEEIAHRTAQILHMRKAYTPAFDYAPPPDDALKAKPASQDGLTPEFIAIAKKQGIYRGNTL